MMPCGICFFGGGGVSGGRRMRFANVCKLID